jgi:hypothetical protein
MGENASMLKGDIEEEVGIVDEGDVLLASLFPSLTLIDAQLNNRRRVDGTAIGRGCIMLAFWKQVQTKPDTNSHFGPEPQARARSGCWITLRQYQRRRPPLVSLWMMDSSGALLWLSSAGMAWAAEARMGAPMVDVIGTIYLIKVSV